MLLLGVMVIMLAVGHREVSARPAEGDPEMSEIVGEEAMGQPIDEVVEPLGPPVQFVSEEAGTGGAAQPGEQIDLSGIGNINPPVILEDPFPLMNEKGENVPGEAPPHGLPDSPAGGNATTNPVDRQADHQAEQVAKDGQTVLGMSLVMTILVIVIVIAIVVGICVFIWWCVRRMNERDIRDQGFNAEVKSVTPVVTAHGQAAQVVEIQPLSEGRSAPVSRPVYAYAPA